MTTAELKDILSRLEKAGGGKDRKLLVLTPEGACETVLSYGCKAHPTTGEYTAFIRFFPKKEKGEL